MQEATYTPTPQFHQHSPSPYVGALEEDQLTNKLGLQPWQVFLWFQNLRAREEPGVPDIYFMS